MYSDAGSTSCATCYSGRCKWIPVVFPPAAIAGTANTDYNTSRTLTGQPYCNGLYTVSYSSTYTVSGVVNYIPAHAFNKITSGSLGAVWKSAQYSASTGIFLNSSVFLVPGYAGDWVTITLPLNVRLSYVRFYQRTTFVGRSPKDYRIYGANASLGGVWNLLLNSSSATYTS
jgi:hypothetical protein